MDRSLDENAGSSGQIDDVDVYVLNSRKLWNRPRPFELSESSEIVCKCGSSGL